MQMVPANELLKHQSLTVFHRAMLDDLQNLRTPKSADWEVKTKICMVKTNGRVADENALLEFLVKTNPKEFLMENDFLSQNFLAQFARRCSSVQKLD